MDGLTCDGCDAGLLIDSDVRYVVKVEGFAAYDPMEIMKEDLDRDFETEMRRTIEQLETLDVDEAQSQVHRALSFDLCPTCWARFVKDPLAGLRGRSDPSSDASASE